MSRTAFVEVYSVSIYTLCAYVLKLQYVSVYKEHHKLYAAWGNVYPAADTGRVSFGRKMELVARQVNNVTADYVSSEGNDKDPQPRSSPCKTDLWLQLYAFTRQHHISSIK